MECKGKNAKVSVKRTVLRIVTSNKRNKADTLRPKGKEVVWRYHEAVRQMDTIPLGSVDST